MTGYFHSVRLDRENCKGCVNCIKRCPTEAIRVRHGKAEIIEEKCIDCGECIRACPNKAKYVETDSLDLLHSYEYKIALPPPSLYGQFRAPTTPDQVLKALVDFGFDDVFEVAVGAEVVAAETKRLFQEGKLRGPVISSACPAVVRLIQVRFPGLTSRILPLAPPSEVAAHLARRGVRLIRGGAFKPRTSPYSFQGLGQQALTMLSQVARRHGLAVVTEVLDPRDLEVVLECADVLQIGARNMFNYPLLQEVGRTRTPILLKRSFQATLEELLLSAEHVMSQGNDQVILCERGIRTFERWTRSTLDISAVPLLKQESHLPVVVDVSHAAGRRDILPPLARAALAAGADGLMLEVHSNPAVALSDGEQQLDLPGFDRLLESLGLPGPG